MSTTDVAKSTMQVGEKLVSLCRQGRPMEAIDTLYAKDVVSIEASDNPAFPREIHGIQGVREKSRWWAENHEVHDMDLNGPYPHDNRFIVLFELDVTPKRTGQRIQMTEVGLYTVEGGKVAKEEFFYVTA